MNGLSKFELRFTIHVVIVALLFNVAYPSFSFIAGNKSFAGKQAICTVLGIDYVDLDNDGKPLQKQADNHCVLCIANASSLHGLLLPVAENLQFKLLPYLSFDWVNNFTSQLRNSNIYSRAPPVL